jgi:predicted DCC family thiol-disulfide oxidoreductase YuxK
MKMDGNYLIYDGDCPFCSRYVDYTRAKASLGGLKLINARDEPDLVSSWAQKGYDLNQGMLLSVDGNIFFGADALNALALSSTEAGLFNWFNAKIFSSKRASRFLYPAMRCGRAITLAALRRRQL